MKRTDTAGKPLESYVIEGPWLLAMLAFSERFGFSVSPNLVETLGERAFVEEVALSIEFGMPSLRLHWPSKSTPGRQLLERLPRIRPAVPDTKEAGTSAGLQSSRLIH